MAKTTPSNRYRRPPACASHRSADLAGRGAALSADIPALFDAPLAPHHKLIGRWVAAREASAQRYTRVQARRHIEAVFSSAVAEILQPIELAELRIDVLHGDGEMHPAIALFSPGMGQIDLGWIETGDAPLAWRAAVYKALEETLHLALPVFCYHDLFEEIAMLYWEGETDDHAARQMLIDIYGAEGGDLDEMTLPSEMNDRRPEWMIAANAAAPSELPSGLRQMLVRLREAHRALKSVRPELNAWHFDFDIARDYAPGLEECSPLPPLTLVPFEQFARELDDVARHGMEYGFLDIVGLCPLTDAARIDDWFASLQLGAAFLARVQDLIQLDPSNL